MCGIIGYLSNNDTKISKKKVSKILAKAFKLSESRGKDSSGILTLNETYIKILKAPIKSTNLIKTFEYKNLLKNYFNSTKSPSSCLIGHARMVTNGDPETYENNQPVFKNNFGAVHNGIIVNEKELRKRIIPNSKISEVDTEVFLDLLKTNYQNDDFTESFRKSMIQIEGANTIVGVSSFSNILNIATSNGSLYYIFSNTQNEIIFCSEKYIIERLIKTRFIKNDFSRRNISQLFPNYFISINMKNLNFRSLKISDFTNDLKIDNVEISREVQYFSLGSIKLKMNQLNVQSSMFHSLRDFDQFFVSINNKVKKLKRCKKCILPSTFPFISFDKDGVCNICNSYTKFHYLGEENLINALSNNNPCATILVPFSGGRDSSYAIHFLKNKLKLNIITFTYDWGLITDLARRNISRLCGELGLEHILVSADLNKKRANVNKNICAWLKNPSLGMVPLFMAGDKHFFYYAYLLKRQMKINSILFSMNPLERTDFKVGFCGVNELANKEKEHYKLSFINKFRLMKYYFSQYLKSPSYFNSTIFDSMKGFISYYGLKHNYKIFYNYIEWNEKIIEDTLINKYGWETAPDSNNTWRIGDGTAPFYNYIYYTLAGFTENDTFRSNQIREGLLSRSEALSKSFEDNQPRWDSIKWYCDVVNIDYIEAINRINSVKSIF